MKKLSCSKVVPLNSFFFEAKCPLNSKMILQPGVDFTKLFRQAKSCQHTVFRKKIRRSISPIKLKAKNYMSKFAKSVRHLPNAIGQKGVEFCARKIYAKMLMKSTLCVPGIVAFINNDIEQLIFYLLGGFVRTI